MARMALVLSIAAALGGCDNATPGPGSSPTAAATAKPDYTAPEAVARLAFSALQSGDPRAVEPFLVTADDITKFAETRPEIKEALKTTPADKVATQFSQGVPESFKRCREAASKTFDLAKATFLGLAPDSSTRKEGNGTEIGYVRFAVKSPDGRIYRFEVQDMIRLDRGWAGGMIGFHGEENKYLWTKVKSIIDELERCIQTFLLAKDKELGDFKGFAELGKIDIEFGSAPAAWAAIGADGMWMEGAKWPRSPATAACFKLETTDKEHVITFDSSRATLPGGPASGTLSWAGGEYRYGGSATAIQEK